jgi:hypothetical protein
MVIGGGCQWFCDEVICKRRHDPEVFKNCQTSLFFGKFLSLFLYYFIELYLKPYFWAFQNGFWILFIRTYIFSVKKDVSIFSVYSTYKLPSHEFYPIRNDWVWTNVIFEGKNNEVLISFSLFFQLLRGDSLTQSIWPIK